MKDSGKDKFEQFFQNSLKGYQENPSDDFWETMEGNIPPSPSISLWKKYWKFGSVLLVSGVVLVASWQWWNYESNLNTIQKTIELQNEKIDKVESQLSEIKNETIENSSLGLNIETKNSIAPNEEKQDIYKNTQERGNSISTNENPQFNSNSNSNSKSNLSQNEFLNNEKTFVNKGFKSGESSLLNKNKISEITKEDVPFTKKENSIFEKISLTEDIATLIPEAVFSKKLELDLSPEWELFVERRKKGFEIYGNFSRVLPPIKVQEIGLVAKRDKTFDLEIGALFHFPIHRNWSMQLGFGYGENTVQSNIKKDFVYDENEVFVSNEVAQTNYRYNLTTNYDGTVIVDSYIHNTKENDGEDLTAGDAFSIDLLYSKKQQYFFLPAFLKFYWRENVMPVDWNFKMGAVQRFAYLKNEQELGTIQNFSNPRLEEHITFVNVQGAPTEKKFDTSIILGVGLEYHLNRYWTLNFETNYKQSLAYHGKVRPASLGIYTGIRWNFFD